MGDWDHAIVSFKYPPGKEQTAYENGQKHIKSKILADLRKMLETTNDAIRHCSDYDTKQNLFSEAVVIEMIATTVREME